MTSFFNEIAGVAHRGPRFFIPGHKGNPAAIPPFAAAVEYDITEVDGAYDLSHPAGALAESQALMAKVYGSGATLYSGFGSTSCILAMMALFVGAGGKVVLARGCHVSAIRALALLDATPVWVLPENGVASPAAVGVALAESGAKAVYVTSPDYYGHLADVRALAEVCKSHGAKLLVDNAHGAYLRFWPGAAGGDLHPLSLGADATADSAHKTLPCLTPAAMLHLKDGAHAQAARDWLNLFSSTSPAYPVTASLDLAARLLSENPPDFVAAGQRLAAAAAGFAQVVAPCADPLRLVLAPGLAGIAPAVFHAALLSAGIAAEYYDGTVLVLMASPWNTEEDFEVLHNILVRFSQTLPRNSIVVDTISPSFEALPTVACGVRQALFGPKQRLAVAATAGRVCAGLSAPCPPGVPLVVPGEVISSEMAGRLAAGGISELDVVQ